MTPGAADADREICRAIERLVHATVSAGYLAAGAGLPELPSVPPPGVRSFQLAQLRVVLPWAARCLDLPAPRPGAGGGGPSTGR